MSLKEQYKSKCEQVQTLYEDLFKESQVFKRQIVGVDEIKKDRDRRVAALREEIEILTKKNDKMGSDHAALVIQHKSVKDELIRYREDYKKLSENLKMANEVRQQAEENLSEIQKQYKTLKEAYNERDLLMGQYRLKFESEQKKLNETERKADVLEIEKRALEKQNEI